MPDVFAREKRSEVMANIKASNTKIEKMVRSWLFSHGFRYRKNDARFPGKPDIVLPKYKTIILVHGCFWHGHQGCKYFSIPKTRTEFWIKKIYGNIERDKNNESNLREMGWNVITVWECELRKNPEIRLNKLIDEIKE